MLDRVAVSPLLLATDGLKEAADGLEAARLEIESLRREAARLDGQHAEVRECLAKWREDNRGVCPTCGRGGFDPLAHGGVHAHH